MMTFMMTLDLYMPSICDFYLVCSIIFIISSNYCQCMPADKSWHEYNESLIERGSVLIDLDFIKSANEEIKNMNKDKVGAPFQYSDNYTYSF